MDLWGAKYIKIKKIARIYIIIFRCYVVAKCNMQHNALLKIILH